MEKIQNLIQEEKKRKKKIILCHGVFDIIHIGHLNHFEEAKKLGDILVVSVTSDKFVKKGPERPIFNLKTRMKFLKKISLVDYVIPSNYPTAKENIITVKPNIYFKGPDYKSKKDFTKRLNLEIKAIKKVGGIIKFSSSQTHSSTRIINLTKNKFNGNQKKFISEIKKKYSINQIIGKINELSKKNFSVIGETIFDEYSFCDPIGISGKDPFLVLKKNYDQSYIGGTFSISKNLSSFTKTINLFSFYNSKKNFLLLKNNKTKNLKLNFVKSRKLIDIEKLRFVDRVSNNKIIGIYNYSELKEKENFDKNLLKNLRKNLDNNFIVADYGHNFISSETKKFISSKKYKYTLNAQVNSINRGYHGLFKYKFPIAIVINENELRYEFKDKFSSIEQLMIKLKTNLKSKNIIVTRGKEGSVLLDEKNKFIYCPSFHEKIIDKVGAGDVLFGFYSVLKFSGFENKLAIFISSIAAGHAVSFLNNKDLINKKLIIDKIEEILK